MLVNEYKRAWLAEQASEYTQRRTLAVARQTAQKRQRNQSQAMRSKLLEEAVMQKGQKISLGILREASKFMAKSTVKGRLGMGIRLSGRIGLRAVPFLGAGMLIYDTYRLVDYLMED